MLRHFRSVSAWTDLLMAPSQQSLGNIASISRISDVIIDCKAHNYMISSHLISSLSDLQPYLARALLRSWLQCIAERVRIAKLMSFWRISTIFVRQWLTRRHKCQWPLKQQKTMFIRRSIGAESEKIGVRRAQTRGMCARHTTHNSFEFQSPP